MRKMGLLGLLTIVFPCVASPAQADDLKEVVSALPPPAFTSSRSLDALERCIGVEVGALMTPIALHGEREVLIYSARVGETKTIVLAISIRDDGERRAVSYWSVRGFDQRLPAAIEGCL